MYTALTWKARMMSDVTGLPGGEARFKIHVVCEHRYKIYMLKCEKMFEVAKHVLKSIVYQ